ncbi:unnamed protein product, partial [Ixodes persulcatus]
WLPHPCPVIVALRPPFSPRLRQQIANRRPSGFPLVDEWKSRVVNNRHVPITGFIMRT